MTLRLRDNRIAGALRAAGSKYTKCAKRATLHGVVAERRTFADNRRAGYDFQHAAPRDLGWCSLLRGRRLGPDGEGVGLLLTQIFLEFFVVGLGDLFPAGDEGVDRGSCSVQRSARRFDWGRKIEIKSMRVLELRRLPDLVHDPSLAIRPLVLCKASDTSVLLGRAGYRFLSRRLSLTLGGCSLTTSPFAITRRRTRLLSGFRQQDLLGSVDLSGEIICAAMIRMDELQQTVVGGTDCSGRGAWLQAKNFPRLLDAYRPILL